MLKLFARLLKETRAIAAVEFAFIAPILVVMFFATVELTSALDCRARVTSATSTAADLVSQATTVGTTSLAIIYAATQQIVYPHDTAAIKLVVSSIVDNGKGGGTVAWSYTKNGTARVKGNTVTLPTGLITSGSGQSVILAEITYSYASPSTTYLVGTITMSSSFYTRPRRSATVTCSDCS
jgi:Flp pilus assembly protein TadG